ncbi:MAG: ABC transporter ATP-binding protein [Lachnospiraceae bacterium]|nr:ABC transporter ATP-binding protein [Lachnospiraceae bacterium]
MEEKKLAICAEQITKMYKLYDKPSDRLKEALGLKKGKLYKEHYALNGVDLSIYKGETVGIIGTNGSGKSTILKIITGVLNATSGNLMVDGRISALLELGAGFNMEYNGIENIYLNGTMMGFSEKEIEARMDSILEFADIGDFVYQPCKTYSSGMFVRLAFAVAINIEPEILIVDEALSVGDVFFQAKCYHKFEEFKKMGKTILFVSHDLSSIAKYCDRVVLLNKGVKLGEGSPKEMIDTYKQVLVGQYQAPEEEALLQDEDVNETAENSTEADQNPQIKEKNTEEKTVQEEKNASAKSKEETKKIIQNLGVNEKALEYGNRDGEITEFYITDKKDVQTSAIIKGEEFTLHMKVKFNNDVPAPIFAFTIKDKHGTEITGTNTMFEKAFLESVKAGESKEITFTQRMDLQGGEYLLSLGLTGYEGDQFQVYHRLYDVLSLTVVSEKNTVGYYDMNSKIVIK